MLRRYGLFLVWLLIPFFLWSRGNADEFEYEPVEGRENWNHTIDISEYNEGTYNLIIKTQDRAGNVQYEGPFNFVVDPSSDLPVTSISNPREGMRIGHTLNVVGTCVDDDAVQGVELKLDDGAFRTVEGTDFWSYALDVAELPDGPHTLTARGIDINNVVGDEVSVNFFLDKTKPVNSIVSHENGALLTGKVTIQGTAVDPNEIESLFYSVDGGETFEPLKFIRNDDETFTFSLEINTNEMEDGPFVYWFKSQDTTGSEGLSPFLFFVDNQAPELNLLYPQAESDGKKGLKLMAPQAKVFSMSGTSTDALGIASLAYWYEGLEEKVYIPFVGGNPYWVETFDLSGMTGDSGVIVFSLEDSTGNITEVPVTIDFDVEGDKPKAELLTPESDWTFQGIPRFSGTLIDNDGPAILVYEVDGEEISRYTVDRGWDIELDVPGGKHALKIYGIDSKGLQGDSVDIEFTRLSQPPVIYLDSYVYGEREAEWEPGIVVDYNLGGILRGRVVSTEAIRGLNYHFSDQEAGNLSLKPDETDPSISHFEYKIPARLEGKRYNLIFEAVDEWGQKGYRASSFYAQSAMLPEGADTPTFSLEKEKGFLSVHSDRDVEGRILVREGSPFKGWLPEGEIADAKIEGNADNVNFRFYNVNVLLDGTQINKPYGVVEFSFKEPGISESVRISVSLKTGRTVKSDSLVLVTDYEAPKVSSLEPQSGTWVKDSIQVSGSVRDNSDISQFKYSFDGETFQNLPIVPQEDGSYSFDHILALDSRQDGILTVYFKAVDYSGNETIYPREYIKDMTPPEFQFVTPVKSIPIYRMTTLSGLVIDEGRVAQVEFSSDGENYSPIDYVNGFFAHELDLALYEDMPEKFYFRVQDNSGNEVIFSPVLNVDMDANKPKVEIQTPPNEGVVRNDFYISGMVFDDDGVKAIYYRLDHGEFEKIEGGNNFSIPIALEDIEDDKHTLEVMAEDSGGVLSDPVSSTFVISKEEPETEIIFPQVDTTVRGNIILRGKTFDANGIEEVGISFDNGNSYQKAMGRSNWFYPLDSRILDDGVYSLLIKGKDKTDTEGLYVTLLNIDNTAPDIKMDYPGEGQILKEDFTLKARAFDNIELVSLKLTLEENALLTEEGDTPAEETEEENLLPNNRFEFDIATRGIFSEEINLSEVPSGWYIMRLEGIDAADNRTTVTRVVSVEKERDYSEIQMAFPTSGETLHSFFSIEGKLHTEFINNQKIIILLDNEVLTLTDINDSGYFRYDIGPDEISEGQHMLKVQVELDNGITIESEPRTVYYEKEGPWATISSFNVGDFISGRPYLEGQAGYYLEYPDSEDPEIINAYTTELKANYVKKVEISLDNGLHFEDAKGKEEWRFRLETQDIPEGEVRILVRVTTGDNQVYDRTIIYLDKTPPELTLINKIEDLHYNNELKLMGLASDINGLEDVMVSVRDGDKSDYEVPSFIQGMYLDVHGLGVTYVDVGLGLTFFDDNVKLQGQVGPAPAYYMEGEKKVPARFSGLVLGGKLLANVANIPFSYFFGPDFEFLSANVALGADFSYFTMTGEEYVFSTENGVFLGSVLGQLEFPKISFNNNTILKYISFYFEGQLWFISSDVEAGTAFLPSFGVRTGLF